MWGSEYGTNPVFNWSTVQMPGTLTPGITIADILKTDTLVAAFLKVPLFGSPL